MMILSMKTVNEDGICKKMSDCSLNRFKPTLKDICSFMTNTVIYCCANETEYGAGNFNQHSSLTLSGTSSSTLPAVENLKPLRPAEAACAEYYPYVDTADPDYEEIIFAGGNLSLADEHLHMTAIGWTNCEGIIDWRCGGSFITDIFIISAAHCTMSGGVNPDIARTGDLNLLIEEKDLAPMDFNIIDVFVHPDYVRTAIYHDIGLLKIERIFYDEIQPACLWLQRKIPVVKLLGVGYGTTQFGGSHCNELYQGELTIVPNDECSIKLSATSELPKGIIPQQLCAQYRADKKDTCQGDSGGPMQFYLGRGERNRKPYITAITSLGENYDGETPGVYTRVSEYIDWIESIVWPQKC